MNIVFLCNSDILSLPTLRWLKNAGHLAAVAVPAHNHHHLLPLLQRSGVNAGIIHAVAKTSLSEDLQKIINAGGANLLLTLTFPWKVPLQVLSLPEVRCYNIHPGRLPDYAGADPIFWQLKNGETYGGVTLHKMTQQIDAGPIVSSTPCPLIPGETYGLHAARISTLIAEQMPIFYERMREGSEVTEQQEIRYFAKPTEGDITISWQTQTADEIEALVNATNPRYRGAITHIRNTRVMILEVAPADLGDAPQSAIPGTIVYADQVYGIIVACKGDQFIRVNVINSSHGFLSGTRMFALGFKVGEKFF